MDCAEVVRSKQSIAGMLITGNTPMPATPRSEDCLIYIRSHACVVCGRPADAHHAFGRRGTAVKSSDFACTPLCPMHHVELHQSGRSSFERGHRVSVVEIAFNLLHRFVVGTWVTMVLDRYAGI